MGLGLGQLCLFDPCRYGKQEQKKPGNVTGLCSTYGGLLGPSPCHSFCASPSFCCYALQALGEVKKKKAKQKKKQKEKERKHQAQGLQGKGGATRELRCDEVRPGEESGGFEPVRDEREEDSEDDEDETPQTRGLRAGQPG